MRKDEMYKDYIYENYDDYLTLDDYFESKNEFMTFIENEMDITNIDFISEDESEDGVQNKIRLMVYTLASPIYDEYKSDLVAYKDVHTFGYRLLNSIIRKVNKWVIERKIQEDLISNATLEKFISNGGTHSETSENAQTGSAVIQKSASTPTGITHNASQEDIEIHLDNNSEDKLTDLSVTDGYEDKYTNFVGKTNGLHRNEVDRDTDIKRTSNYGLALEILDKIPYSFISDVLREVSQHFIQVY